MTAEDICWTTAVAACLPNALRQGASRAPREKILGARHEALARFFPAQPQTRNFATYCFCRRMLNSMHVCR
jgi:hypothetical protein